MQTNMGLLAKLPAELAGEPENTDSNDWPERQEVLYAQNNPGLWAEICRQALTLAPNPVVRIWLLIEQANGLRRQKTWEMQDVKGLINEAWQATQALGEGHPRQARLEEVLAYHYSLILHAEGNFGEAAEFQDVSANRASDPFLKLVNKFHAAMERLNDAIVRDNWTRITRFYTLFMEYTRAVIKQAQYSEVPEQIRWCGNVICNGTFYSWLIELASKNRPEKEREEWLTYLRSLPDDLKPAFGYALIVIEAIDAFGKGQYQRVIDLIVDDLGDEVVDLEWRANGLLVKMVAWRRLGQRQNIAASVAVLKGLVNENQLGWTAVQVAAFENNFLPW